MTLLPAGPVRGGSSGVTSQGIAPVTIIVLLGEKDTFGWNHSETSPRPEHTIVNRETSAIKAPAGGGWDKYFGLADSSPHGPRAGWTGGRLAGHL